MSLNRSPATLLALSALLGSAAIVGAVAQDGVGFPRGTGFIENMAIDYGPSPRRNEFIFGGGTVRVIGNGEDEVRDYVGPQIAQQPRPGPVPLLAMTNISDAVQNPTGPAR